MKAMNLTLLVCLALASGCAEVRYNTLTEGILDPDYTFKAGATMGIIPVSADPKKEVDGLLEKKIIRFFNKEFTDRGFKVHEYKPDELTIKDGKAEPKDAKQPELILVVNFDQKQGAIEIPTQTYGSYGNEWGYSSGTGAHTVRTYTNVIMARIWASESKDNAPPVWKGSIVKGSPSPNLNETAEQMIHLLLAKKFPVARAIATH